MPLRRQKTSSPNLAALIQRNLELWKIKRQDTVFQSQHCGHLQRLFVLPLFDKLFLLFVLFLTTHSRSHIHPCALFSCSGQMGALQRQVCMGVSSQHAELLFSRPLAYAACSHHYCLYTLSNHYTL